MESSKSTTEGETLPSSSSMIMVQGPTMFTGGTFTNIITHTRAPNDYRRVILESFKDHIALNVTHDSNDLVDPPRCHPKTRIAILQELTEWVRAPDSDSLLVTWLYGPSGIGKSAIGGSLADILYSDGRLAASFFFRPDKNENLGRIFVPTIAFQLAFFIPGIQPYIAAAVDRNPLIFHQSLETQMEQLVLGPILLSVDDFQRSIIIDGLDECPSQDLQRRILSIIGDAAPRLAGRIKFLILSQPKPTISRLFNFPALASITNPINMKKCISLHEDIRIFLQDRLEQIKAANRFSSELHSSWPEEALLELVILKSAGNFTFPRALIEYMENLNDNSQFQDQFDLHTRLTYTLSRNCITCDTAFQYIPN